MSIVSSIKHFHVYLYGHHFKVSDHSSLRWLMNFNILEGQTARFLEFLSSYDFHVEHRSGVTHRNADALSRRPCSDNNCEYCEKIERRNEINDSGLITRENQITVERSSVREPEMKDGMLRCTTIEMDALVPSSLETGKSEGSVKVHLHESSYEKDIPDSCSDNIPQVIYSTQNSQMSQGDDRNCSTKTRLTNNSQDLMSTMSNHKLTVPAYTM